MKAQSIFWNLGTQWLNGKWIWHKLTKSRISKALKNILILFKQIISILFRCILIPWVTNGKNQPKRRDLATSSSLNLEVRDRMMHHLRQESTSEAHQRWTIRVAFQVERIATSETWLRSIITTKCTLRKINQPKIAMKNHIQTSSASKRTLHWQEVIKWTKDKLVCTRISKSRLKRSSKNRWWQTYG